MTTLASVIGRGVIADRPAAPAAGSLWYATDDDALTRYNGSTWDAFGTGSAAYTDENARDAIAAALVAGTNVTITPDDGADTITIDAAGGLTLEQVYDALGTVLTEGAGIDITVNDGADTITLASTITQYTDEMARDALATALVAGTNITITPNDALDTITIDATAGGLTQEQVEDAVAALLVAGTGVTLTYNDATPSLTIDATGGGGGGLTLIEAQSFTAVSAVNFDDVFTSEYDDYRVTCTLTAGSAVTFTRGRLRAAAADNSAANYDLGMIQVIATTDAFAGIGEMAQTSWWWGYMDSAGHCTFAYDINSPALAQFTHYRGQLSRGSATTFMNYTATGQHDTTTAFDGVSIFPDSGTITGRAAIYGYQKTV